MRKLYFLSVLFASYFYCLPLMAQWDTASLSVGRWRMGLATAGNKAFFAGGFTYSSPLAFDLPSDQLDIFDGVTNQWTTGKLSAPRHTITTFSTDDMAFFAGGLTGISAFASNFTPRVDIYTASTGKWTTANLSEGRSNMAVTMAGGKVLFAGGYKFQFYPSDVVDIYDKATNKWTVTNLPTEYSNLIATAVGNTAVFVSPLQLLLYNVSTGQWTKKNIPLPRSGKAVTTVGNKVFIAGGTTSDGQPSDRVDIYDVPADQWTTAQLAQPRSDISAIAVGNKSFFAGGSSNAKTVDIYDANTNQWTTAQLATGRLGMAITTAGSKVFFAGSNLGSPIVDIYDLVTNQWSATQLPRVTAELSAVSVNGKALFAENGTGSSPYGQNSKGRVDIYTTNTSSQTLLDVSTNSVSLSAIASNAASFSVTANTSWSVRSSEAWLTPSPTSGAGNQVITLAATTNTSIASRTAVITISSAGLSDRILTVTQAGAAPALSVSSQRLSFTADSGIPLSITITSNTSWSITSSASWLSTSVVSGTGTQGLSVSAAANQSITPRTAILTITANGVLSQTVNVTQAGTPTTLALSIVSPVGAAGSTTSVTLTSNASWSVSSSQSWLVASPTSGTGTAVITLTASANSQVESRTATITIAVDGIPNQTIIVVQAGVIILGVADPLADPVVVYPNPVSDKLYIRGLPPKATVILYDPIGRLLSQQPGTGPIHTLPTGMLPAGLYYLRIESDQQTLNKQFMKIP